jgi:hypothetical protein
MPNTAEKKLGVLCLGIEQCNSVVTSCRVFFDPTAKPSGFVCPLASLAIIVVYSRLTRAFVDKHF